jgi:hypothetical protein
MGLIPSLMRRAEWQHRAGLIYDERATYRRVIRVIESHESKDDLALVEPLVRLGRSFFYPDKSGQQAFSQASMATGEIYFKRALRIAAESPDTTWNIVADATLALGDYYMFEGNAQRARQEYRLAWDLLSESGDHTEKLAKRHAELESPVSLLESEPPHFVGDSNPELAADPVDPVLQGHITIRYDISTRGRPTDLELVEAQPPEFEDMQRAVQRAIRRRIYRPVFVDGEVIETKNRIYVHDFKYRQSDLDAVREPAPADEESS